MPDDSLSDGLLRRNRALREMLDLARRVIADGVVSEDEARTFREWLERNPDMVGVWPLDSLVRRFRAIFDAGELSPEDREALSRQLREITGESLGERGEFGRLHTDDEDDEDGVDEEPEQGGGDEGAG